MHAGGAHGGESAPCSLNLRQLVAQHLEEINTQGFALVGVAAQGMEPGWMYTVGLWHSADHPELIVVGLPPRTAHALLLVLASRVIAGHLIFPGSYRKGPLPIEPVAVVDVDDIWRSASDYFNLGRIIVDEGWGLQDWPPTQQVLWADRWGRFPGDDEAAPQAQILQPQLAVDRPAGL